MTASDVLEIVDLALSLIKTNAGGNVQQDATLADTVVQIIAKAVQINRDNASKPVDPSQIKAETPV